MTYTRILRRCVYIWTEKVHQTCQKRICGNTYSKTSTLQTWLKVTGKVNRPTSETPMEGVGQSHNPLKRPKTDVVQDSPKSQEDGQKPPKKRAGQGSETTADDKIPKAGKSGEDDKIDHSYANGSDANPMLSDLMAEIRSVNETVKDIKITVADTKADMSRIADRMTRTENIDEDASKLVVEVRNDLTKEINSLKEQLVAIKMSSEMPGSTSALKEMRSQMEKQEAYSRRYNLVIDGIDEAKGEMAKALRQKVDSFFINILGVSSVRFDIAHRLGPVRGTGSRRVIVKFRCLTDKNIIWEARDKLKTKANSGYKLLLDRPAAAKEREALAFRIVYTANKSSNFNNAKFQSGKIHIDGVAFDYEDIDNLPEELSPCNVYTPSNSCTMTNRATVAP